MTIAKQSGLNVSEQLINECANSSINLSIENNNSAIRMASTSQAAGLLILSVSPN